MLGLKRKEFTMFLAVFISWLISQGYEVMIEQVKRTQAEAAANAASGAGILHSLHLLGLAADLSIFKDGRLLTSVDDLRFAGEKWKSLHPEHAWGGDFHTRPDADHFSRMHEGVR